MFSHKMADTTFPQLIMNSIAASAHASHDNQPLQMAGDMVSNYLRSTGLSSNTMWKPVYSLNDTDTTLVIYIDLPGVPVDGVSMTFNNDIIQISGERFAPDTQINRGGVPYGKFQQCIKMPINVTNPDSVQTKLELGVLKIVIDKSVEARGVFSVTVK